MLFIFIISIIILSIILIINYFNKQKLKTHFNNSNVIVYGKKGSGKDILFNFITNTRKKYYSNIPYTNKNYQLITPNDLKLGDNSFENLLNNNIEKTEWDYQEGIDFFISDCGVYLPSQFDSVLHKKYKGLPLFYALSRHIGKHNVHCNAQNLERIWKALREQADIYIKTLKTIKLPFLLIVKYRIYDKYSSAVNDIRITKGSIFHTSDNIKIQNANVGEIKEGFIIVTKFKTKYNSRYFKQLFIK